MTRRAVAWLCLLVGACDSAATQEPPSREPPAKAESPATPPEEEPPVTDRKPQTHLSGATDAVLAGDAADEALETLLETMIDDETMGIRIDAPFALDAAATEIPVVGAFVRIPDKGEAFENRLAVFASWSGGFAAAPALRSPKMKGGKKSPGGDAVRGSSFSFDARARLPDAAWTGQVRIHAGYGGHLSNGVTVHVGGDAPMAPAEPPSVSIEGPAAATTEPGGVVELSGRGTGTVQIVALGGPDPFVHPVDAKDDGTFSVNLLGDNPLPKAPGTWHIYAFAGEHVAGPVTIELTPGAKPW